MKLGFTRSNNYPKICFKVDRENPLILVLYVDDLFLIGVNRLIHQWKRDLSSDEGSKTDILIPRPEVLAET